MSKCPNCNYELVLLSHRRKYKCAKCGKLFPQKEIESKEFREQNEKEREQGRKQWLKEARDNYNAGKAIPKIIEELKNPKPKKTKEDYNAGRREQYKQNKIKVLAKQKEYRKKSGQAINERARIRRLNNIEKERQKTRIKFWRNEQKEFALRIFENGLYKVYNASLSDGLPTILLS